MAHIVVSGGTGFIGRALLEAALARRHRVTAIVRAGSASRLPTGVEVCIADPFNRSTFIDAIRGADAVVQLIGTPHPNPAKANEFRRIDGSAGTEGAHACKEAGIGQYIYCSIPHDIPIMRAYVHVRVEVEALIATLGLRATIIRPFYVLGPGRRWPYVTMPFLWVIRHLPGLSALTRSMVFTTRATVVQKILDAIDDPPSGIRVIDAVDLQVHR